MHQDLLDAAVVGCGAIACNQHIPFLIGSENGTGLRLAATVDPAGAPKMGLSGIRHYADLDDLLQRDPGIKAVSICTPPSTHFSLATTVLSAGKHVLLEKPPTLTVHELRSLHADANRNKVTLLTAYHARFNEAVERLREELSGKPAPARVHIEWREDFERWHSGQIWPWRENGFGVYDPGINALSILCHVLPQAEFRVTRAQHLTPQGAATPSLASIDLDWNDHNSICRANFEWRLGGQDVWDIEIHPSSAENEYYVLRGVRWLLRYTSNRLQGLNAEEISEPGPDREYAGIYRHFRSLIDAGKCDVSYREIRIVENAFRIAEPWHQTE